MKEKIIKIASLFNRQSSC